MTDQKKQLKLVEALGDYIARYVEENSPVTRTFRPYSLSINICGTRNLAILKVSLDGAHPETLQLRLQLGVVRQGTDRLYSNFMSAADAAEYGLIDKVKIDSVNPAHFIPCKHENQVGMLDIISGTFYPNANTAGAFTIAITDKQ